MSSNISEDGKSYYITFASSKANKFFDFPHAMIFFEVFENSKLIDNQAVGFYPAKSNDAKLVFIPRPGRIWNEVIKDCDVIGTPYTCDNNYTQIRDSFRIKVDQEVYNKALLARLSFTKQYWELSLSFF